MQGLASLVLACAMGLLAPWTPRRAAPVQSDGFLPSNGPFAPRLAPSSGCAFRTALDRCERASPPRGRGPQAWALEAGRARA